MEENALLEMFAGTTVLITGPIVDANGEQFDFTDFDLIWILRKTDCNGDIAAMKTSEDGSITTDATGHVFIALDRVDTVECDGTYYHQLDIFKDADLDGETIIPAVYDTPFFGHIDITPTGIK
jgi:hypothetical protein